MRRSRGLLLWLPTCLAVVFVVLTIARSSTELLGSALPAVEKRGGDAPWESRGDDRWVARSQARRYVTPSLAELSGRGRLPYMHKHVLMLTRIPGAGAELMVLILQRLQGYNAFKHIRLPAGDHGLLSTLQQELLVEEMTSIIKQEAIPLSFDGDVRFLNFSEFGRQGPSFISLVRDPLDPRIWRRYSKGKERVFYRGAIPHFCGQEPRCTERNNTWALARAKANVVRWYPVVGILDYMEESLNALALEFPYFFKDAVRIYKQFRLKEKRPTVSTVPFKLRDRNASLQMALALEVEFYQWLKSRLFNETFKNG
ncbi:uronyl 2-sulfotransferase [Harpegnathos saltator]|nr:uronyl 2-sulfotransferase [Harpegnathos saltator]